MQKNFVKCLARTIRLYQSRLDAAKTHVETDGITVDDVIALETAVGELRKLIGGTGADLKRKIAEWEMLCREYIEAKDEKGKYDATWVLVALNTMEVGDAKEPAVETVDTPLGDRLDGGAGEADF